MVAGFYVTISNLQELNWSSKLASMKHYLLEKCLRFPPLLIRQLGLCTQAFQQGISITFVYTFILTIYVSSRKVCVFYVCIFSTKLDLFEATCFIILPP